MVWTHLEDENRHSCKGSDLLISNWSQEEERTSRIDWIQTIKQDLKRGGLKWEDLPELTANRVYWKQLTAICAGNNGNNNGNN